MSSGVKMDKIDSEIIELRHFSYLLLEEIEERCKHVKVLLNNKQTPAMTTDIPLEACSLLLANLKALSSLQKIKI